MPQNIYTGLCKCKKFGHGSVNDLHAIYMTIDTYMYKVFTNKLKPSNSMKMAGSWPVTLMNGVNVRHKSETSDLGSSNEHSMCDKSMGCLFGLGCCFMQSHNHCCVHKCQ